MVVCELYIASLPKPNSRFERKQAHSLRQREMSKEPETKTTRDHFYRFECMVQLLSYNIMIGIMIA